jgi:hypothetical protein
VTRKNVVFWDIQTQFVPQRRHYISAIEHSRIMLCKIWGFHVGDYEKCRLLGYKNPVPTSKWTHYISAIEHSRLMICKIWGFHRGDNEERRLLGYKIPVRTSQETHYVSATENSRLMLCKILDFHGCGYVDCRLLGVAPRGCCQSLCDLISGDGFPPNYTGYIRSLQLFPRKSSSLDAHF